MRPCPITYEICKHDQKIHSKRKELLATSFLSEKIRGVYLDLIEERWQRII
jgi:hypothetical protein